MLREDGPFEIIARPGELAIVGTIGFIDREILKQWEDGEADYWGMRANLTPLAIGLRRFISASPGQEIGDLDVAIVHRTDHLVPVDLDNPPFAEAGGPQFYGVLPRLNLGSEGFWELDTQSVSIDPAIDLRDMPTLEPIVDVDGNVLEPGFDQDIEFYLIGVAFSDTPDQLPMSISVEETRDVEAGVLITPFVGSTFPINPAGGGILGPDRHVTWGVHDGFDAPIRPPSANLVLIEEPGLGPPKPLWRFVTPSLVTEFDIPELPEFAGETGLGAGFMSLRVLPFIVTGEFDYEDFSYDDLGQYSWKSWGVSQVNFTP